MIKNTLFQLFALGACFSLSAQKIDTIDRPQTPNHVEIPGTKYLLQKPDTTFVIATDFTGFMNRDLEAGINITEAPLPFSTVLSMFSKDMPPKNAKLVLEKDLLLNGHTAKLYKTDGFYDSILNPQNDQNPAVLWLLMYADEPNCYILSATYSSSKDTELSDKVEQSLLSFRYVADKVVNPLDGLTFQIDVSNTPLKFASTVMQTGAAFTIDGLIPTKAADRTTYIIMILPVPIPGDEQKEAAIKTVKSILDENTEIKSTNPITLGGLSGYEVIGYERQNQAETFHYAVTLFDKGRYFILRGTSQTDKLDLFRKISQTFVLRG